MNVLYDGDKVDSAWTQFFKSYGFSPAVGRKFAPIAVEEWPVEHELA